MKKSAATKKATRRKRSAPPRPLVLLVEDFKDNREMYAEYLEFAGFRVAQAEDGRAAVRMARELEPDCVVMDLALPGIDGIEATRLLRTDRRTRDTPVIALTGHALAKVSMRAREVGCDAFLAKPCLPDALAREVRRVLEEKGVG